MTTQGHKLAALLGVILTATAVTVAAQQQQADSPKEDPADSPMAADRQDANNNQESNDAAGARIQHGEYIVHHVAMCVVCHSPKDETTGRIIDTRLLQGAPMPVASPYPERQWAFRAPKLAGLPAGWTYEELVAFLQTGEAPTLHAPRPPMPPFRMTPEDARAVADYLQSLQ